MNDLASNRYDVALSFAGEDRPYVRRVADFLRANHVEVFYDEFEQVRLWGVDLRETLDRIYRKESEFVIVFVSLAYHDKQWTRHEFRSAMAAALESKRDLVLPVRFDNTELDGLSPTIGFIDVYKSNMSPGELGALLLKKLKDHAGQRSSTTPPSTVPDYSAWRVSRAPYAHDFSGRGAAMFGSRWNHPGTSIVYTAASLCMAIFETIVHLDRSYRSNDFVSTRIKIPSDISMKTIYSAALPQDWQTDSGYSRDLGTDWARSMESCVLSLPSLLLPEDRVYILNPAHPEFRRLRIDEAQPLKIDPRLFGG